MAGGAVCLLSSYQRGRGQREGESGKERKREGGRDGQAVPETVTTQNSTISPVDELSFIEHAAM